MQIDEDTLATKNCYNENIWFCTNNNNVTVSHSVSVNVVAVASNAADFDRTKSHYRYYTHGKNLFSFCFCLEIIFMMFVERFVFFFGVVDGAKLCIQ